MKNVGFLLVVLTLAACSAAPSSGDAMPTGPSTPGSYVTITPDPSPLVPLTSAQAPTAGMDVASADIQALTQLLLNVQNQARERVWFTQAIQSAPVLLGPTSMTTYDMLASVTLPVPAAAGDIVSGEIRAWANCIATYKVDTYVSEAGGGEIAMTPEVRHAATASGSDFDPLVLSFTRTVVTPGSFAIHLKGFTNDGGHPLSVYFTFRMFAQRGA